MFGLKTDTYTLNTNGNGQYELFADVSTRSLNSVLVGEGAGKISKGTANAFVGFESGKKNLEGSFGVFVGFQAGALNQYGNLNTFVGAYAGRANNRGDRNTFVGYQAGQLNRDGSECTAVGVGAMRENATGNRNVAVGIRAGERIVEGDNNTMIGAESGQDIRSGNLNTMAGYRSGRASFRGNENTYFGAYAGYSNSFGDANAFVGYRAGEYLGFGNFNVAVGAYALQKATFGSCNIAIGAFSGSVATGSGNVYVGTGAGGSNLRGDNNTNVGNNAGYYGNGSENVYLGKDAALQLQGNQNVVIGVHAYPQQHSSGSVVIGYKAGSTVFRSGSCNIFIGIGADAHTENTSYGIAIGSKDTYANTHSISVGETIDNGGINSVLLGYSIYSDADQCVSIGHSVEVNSVDVFDDPLNWRFPISITQGYKKFYLSENYSNLLYLGGVSNTVAIGTIYASNIYDSGNNLLEGNTRTQDMYLRAKFDYNLLYQGNVIQQKQPMELGTTFRDYVVNTSNLLITDNFKPSVLIIPDTSFSFNNTDISSNVYNILINIGALYENSNIRVSCNLIPTQATQVDYKIVVAKRLLLTSINDTTHVREYKVQDSMVHYLSNTIPYRITQGLNNFTPNINDYPDAIQQIATNMVYQQKYYVYQQPSYGTFNSNIYPDSDPNRYIAYTPYPEAMYACNDTFTIVIANQMKSQRDVGIYGSIPEETYIKPQSILFTSNQHMLVQPRIYLHPTTKTYIDRSYLNLIPYPPRDYGNITFQGMDTNLLLTFNQVSYNSVGIGTLQIPYDTFTTTPFSLEVLEKKTDVVAPLHIQWKGLDYYYQCTYLSNINYSNVHSNVFVRIEPFTMTPVSIPYATKEYTYVIDYPKYGKIGIPTSLSEPIQYEPFTYNFGDDTCTLLVGDSFANHTFVDVSFRTSNQFYSLPLYKMQEDVFISDTSNAYIPYTTQVNPNLSLYTIYYHNYTSTLNGSPNTNPWGNYSYSDTYLVKDPWAYDKQIGYAYGCNILLTSNYTTRTWDEVKAISPDIRDVNDVPSGGQDYIIYDTSIDPNPKVRYHKYLWNYSTNSRFTNPFESTDVEKSAPIYYTISNSLNINRYYLLVYDEKYERVYKYACNLAIYHSNEYLWHDIYYDKYNNYIYTSNYNIPYLFRSSNISYLEDSATAPTYTRTDISIRTERFSSSNIPTVQLKDISTYEYNGYYQLTPENSNNFLVLQKGKGPVSYFYQSNISREEIHIWNTQSSETFVDFYQTSNLYFTEKGLTIQYFRNSTSTPSLNTDGSIKDITFENGVNDILYLDYSSASGYNQIAIQHTCNVAFMRSDTKIPRTSFNFATERELVQGIIGTGFSNNAFVDYINYGNAAARKPIRKYIPVSYKINQPLYLNIGFLQTLEGTLTSNELLYMYRTTSASDVLYTLTNIPNGLDIYKDTTLLITSNTFTQSDINHQRISLKGHSIETVSIGYDITVSTDPSVIHRDTLSVRKFAQNIFLPSVASNTSCNVLLQVENRYQHQRLGTLWSNIEENVAYNPVLQNMTFHITKNPQKGYLYSSNQAYHMGCNMVNKLTYQELCEDKLLYIPYIPMALSNDTMEGFFQYSNIVSPIYTLPIKNYWSRWGPLVVPMNNVNFEDTSVYNNPNAYAYYTSNLPRSYGMVQDGIVWSPSVVSLPGFNPDTTYLGSSITPTLTLSYQNQSITPRIHIEPISQRPIFQVASNSIVVDTGNYTYLDSILSTLQNPSQTVQFFIMERPSEGVILKQTTENQFMASPYFSSEDIRTKRVFYQHYGSNNEAIDYVKLQVGTHPYDISCNVLVMKVSPLPLPQLTVNNFDYIYYSNISLGSNSYNILDTSRLQISSGSIYVYERSNIDIFRKQGDTYLSTNLFTKEEIAGESIYYRPSSNFFQQGFNSNSPMSFKFLTNSNALITEPNKLSVFPEYKNIYQQEWFSKYNTFDSINEIKGYINSNQSITYTKFVNTTSNLSFHNKKCKIEFDYLPYQNSLVNIANQAARTFGEKYLSFLRTYRYSYELINKDNYVLFKMDFSHQKIDVYTSNVLRFSITKATEKNATNSLFDFGTFEDWNNAYIINNDDQNNRYLSIYLNNRNYTSYTQGENLLPSLNLDNLQQVKLNVPIYDAFNYYNYTITSNIGPGTNIYYNLVNYNTQVRFRNFKILLGTYDLGTTETVSTDGDFYNIIIGDQLKINGFNNICLGKNFSTTGTGSIILGSDIGIQLDETGAPRGTFNEIFNSIVISTSSFINSKVRDVIAIGNDIFNNVGGNIDDFLSKKPVLVGNNIDETKIDFHINFQNTFLKTTVGYPQIYCGLEGEPVCIGYTGNQQVSGSDGYKLYVNGGIYTTGDVVQGSASVFSKKALFGNILFTTGTSHRCKVVISWTNAQSVDTYAFSIHIKFRFIRNSGSYGYRRFETWITPVNDELRNTPNLLSDLEISSFGTPDITNIEHNIEREGERSVALYITWDTLDILTPTDSMVGTMEIEAVAPTVLGTIFFSTPISIPT